MQKNIQAGNYKAYNILHKIRYWKLRGESLDFLFDGLDLNYDDLQESDWLDFKSEVRLIWDNELKKMPNPRAYEAQAYDIYKNRDMGLSDIIISLASLKFTFKKFSDYAQLYTLVESLSSHRLTASSAVILYKPKDEFFGNFGISNSCYLKGLLRALPNYESIDSKNQALANDAKVRMTFVCFDIEKTLKDDYAFLTSDLTIKKEETELFVNGEVYAKKIRLDTEKSKLGLLNDLFSILKRNKNFIYAPPRKIKDNNSPKNFGNDAYGFYVIKDLILENIKVLKKGEIFNAPYCRYEVTWLNVSIFHRLCFFFKDAPKMIKSSKKKMLEQVEISDQRYFNEIRARQSEQVALSKLKKYTEQLEEKVRERTKDLHKQKEKVENAQTILKRYLSPQVTQKIIEGEIESVWKHHRKKLTFFFSDIKDFTITTDVMEPEDMANLINEYLSAMMEIIHHYNGTLAQIIGDALYVFFGAPEFTSDKDHAIRCVKMAIDMQTKMEKLQNRWYDLGIEHPFKIRCGINTGMATVGGYGSEKRREYTAMGMQVNLTARLENKCVPGSILISHPTWALIKDDIDTEELGFFEAKGFHHPIKIYNVIF